MRALRGLYAIVDADAVARSGLSLLGFAAAVLAARPPVLQLRAKRLGAGETLALLRDLRAPCTAAGALLFANDRPDLAVLAGCDGVHVGQTDLGVADVRRFAPGLRVGVSTHDLGQLRTALAEHPDYVAFGPVFDTASKERPDPTVGIDGLRQAAELTHRASIPLVAIGGIGVEQAVAVARYADLSAVIGALGAAEAAGITERARTLQVALGGGRQQG